MADSESTAGFQWEDYLVFGSMLAVSAGIGIFFGIKDRKKQDTTEFLMAGKSLGTFPIAMSLIASFISAITLLGTPSEVYKYGTLYWLIGFSYFLVMPAAAYLYLPVFFDLQVTSAYEYLEIRFHRYIRLLGACIFILQMVLYMAIVVYAPALALEQVTGIDPILACALICFVCMFYTTLGGMKAVVWTDTVQVILMYVSMMLVTFKGMSDEGGFNEVWEKNENGGRVELINWDPNPITRHSIWSLIIGGYFTWLANYGVNQAQIQRYLSVKKKSMAVRALWINLFALFFIMILSAYSGMVIYAHYYDCDPISNGQISKSDQLMPLLVMDTLGEWPGLPGLFVSGIFSGALSTVSSGMNSLAAICLEDFLKGGLWPNITEKQAMWASKGLSLFFGLLTFALVFVAKQMQGVLSAALSIFGMIGGPLLGLFSLGMFFPWANYKGAFVGTITGLVFTCWIGLGQQIVLPDYEKLGCSYWPLEMRTDGCSNSSIITTTTTTMARSLYKDDCVERSGEVLAIYELSYMWFSATGCCSVVLVGLIVSLLTGGQDVRQLNPSTLSPGLHLIKRFLPGLQHLGEDYISKEKSLESKGISNQGFENTPEENMSISHL